MTERIHNEINTFLSEATNFEGKVTFNGVIRIDGKFKGEIKSKDTLIVGEKAEIRADITVGNAVIYGRVIGNILATSQIEIKKSAQVFGRIHTDALDVESGALFEGNCEMLKKSPESITGSLEEAPVSDEKENNVIEFDKAKEKATKKVVN